MRKNQKYSKEEMFRAIELWNESGLTQVKFCAHEKLSVKTFSYWLRKYKKEKGLAVFLKEKVHPTFIPVEVPVAVKGIFPDTGRIEISFPNGVQVNCPAGIDIHQLKTLINF